MRGGGGERIFRDFTSPGLSFLPVVNHPPAGDQAQSDSSLVVKLSGVVSLIGRFPALAGADLSVGSGEVVLLTGPNGAGKTTLLRVCAGLAPVNRGNASVLGFNLARRNDRRIVRRHVGLLGHSNALYDELSVAENITFWAKANGADMASVEPAMERLGLSGRLRSVPVRGLSAGQRRRTAMAVLVCRRPRLWLLDEPHAGLDAEGRDLIDSLIRQAVESGATALVASHEPDRIATLATRSVVVAGGRVNDGAFS